MTSIADIAASTVTRHELLPEDAVVLVMVSGGGDSMALLELLSAGAFGAFPLRVLHVNHLLRDSDALEDERFVLRRCEVLGIECRVVRFDVGAFARESGLNVEDAGRRIRYRFAEEELDAWCRSLGLRESAGRIAVAHTLDDRVETFFMRVVSGGGMGALASIAPKRGRIVRPLIECERAGVRAFLQGAGVEWREDATNEDTSRMRARIRAQILPVVEDLNPSVRRTLARTMDLLAEEDALLDRMAHGFVRDFARVDENEVRFERELMRTLEPVMARRTVRAALRRAFPDAARLEGSHIDAVTEAMARDSFARDLPFGLRVFSEYGTLVVARGGADASPRMAPCLLPMPGRAHLGRAGSVIATEEAAGIVRGSADSIVVDADIVEFGLTVGPVHEGDRMRPLGMTGSRKLSDLLVDAKVPRRMRGLVPVVRDGERIVWLAGVRMSDEYRVTEGTRRMTRLTWERPRDEPGVEEPTGVDE
jgi:tRNA(Ile)-lysidine synthase